MPPPYSSRLQLTKAILEPLLTNASISPTDSSDLETVLTGDEVTIRNRTVVEDNNGDGIFLQPSLSLKENGLYVKTPDSVLEFNDGYYKFISEGAAWKSNTTLYAPTLVLESSLNDANENIKLSSKKVIHKLWIG